jgi:hypothetical protein
VVAADELPALDEVGAVLELVLLELFELLEPELPVLVLDVPVVPLVVFEACAAVELWLARMATAPVPTPVTASSPMVAAATRRLPSSLVVTASPSGTTAAAFSPSGRSFAAKAMDQLCLRRAVPRPEKGLHCPHTPD